MNSELEQDVHDALRQLRSVSRKYRKETGLPVSRLISGGAPIVHIESRLLTSAVCVSSREFLLPLVPRGGYACEVGTSTGFFARAIERVLQPIELHLIDMDFSRIERDKFINYSPDRIFEHIGNSWDELRKFEGFFDFIYIDAGHSYKDVKRDIASALRAIKPTGYIMFNDYTRWSVEQVKYYGVQAAVNELANQEGWAFRGLAMSGSGHFDVLLSRDTEEMNMLHADQLQQAKQEPVSDYREKYVRKR